MNGKKAKACRKAWRSFYTEEMDRGLSLTLHRGQIINPYRRGYRLFKQAARGKAVA